MFTGLVEELGKVTAVQKGKESLRLTVAAKKVLADIKLGDSIAVNGACLTVVEYNDAQFTADVMPETVDKTAFRLLKKGESVNLERTLQVGSRLGGHIVSGHVDGLGTILAKESDDNAVLVRIQTTSAIMRYIVKKGSIAIDGISLTIADLGTDWFMVSIIPHTAKETTLGLKPPGVEVNLETDIIGKYVEKLLGGGVKDNRESSLTMDMLQKYGFSK
ncbi:MAG: riboflavin synthase [Pelosinus sp.]|nr:riboflavin synthase [Pelosinus sp.]